MGRSSVRCVGTQTTTEALVLRAVPFAESDTIFTLFTKALGKVSALARGARKGGKRWTGTLEPMHTLRVVLHERPTAELCTLRESAILRPRFGLVADLDRLEAAGQALRWVRAGSPLRTSEPAVWAELEGLLERLDAGSDEVPAATHLAATGLRLVAAFGYELDLSRCVRCGRPCSDGRPAFVDAGLGGLVCQACGGGHSGHRLLDPAVRRRLLSACSGCDSALLSSDTEVARQLVDEALLAHAGVSD